MKIKTTDAIVQAVIKKMDNRSLEGQRKYGSTMTDEINDGKKDLNDNRCTRRNNGCVIIY